MEEQMANSCGQYQTSLEIAAKQLGVDLQSRLQEVTARLQSDARQIQEDAPDPSNFEGAINFEFDVSWKDVELILSLPEFTMETQEWSLDVPQVTMREKEMIFHTPSMRMTTKKIGQYPEVHGLRIEWKDILIDVPEFFMEEQRIVMGIPEFKTDRTSFKLDVPEVAMREQRIVLGLPQFTLTEISGEVRSIQDRSEALTKAANAEVAKARGEIASTAADDISKKANSLFTCLRTTLQNKKAEAMAMVEPAITMLQESISKLGSIDADEARAKIGEIQAQLAAANAKKAEMEARFSESIDALIAKEQDTVKQILTRLTAVA
jgi:hypothetical protein